MLVEDDFEIWLLIDVGKKWFSNLIIDSCVYKIILKLDDLVMKLQNYFKIW